MDTNEAFIIGKICKGHSKEDLSDTRDFKYDYAFNLEKINIPLLASMLRLANELDIAYTRTPKIIYENLDISNEESIAQWDKH
jgi:hypothetical protein